MIEPVLGPLETTVIVIIVAIFVLMQRDDLRDRFIRLVGSTDLHRTTTAMDDAGKRLSRYFVSQLGVNACFGLVIGVGLWLIGVPAPALWGVLAGLLRFVPYVGALLAAVAPLALAAAIDPGWRTTIYVALLFVTIEPLTGYVVEPLLYGHSTGLSPMSVIVAAVFWTWMWGPVGLILSTPLTLCLVVLGRHVKSLEFLDVLLGDRPALSEADRFYQRALANDPDEALDQAEKMLADRSLVDYYDSVVLPALKLAAHDEARGTITRTASPKSHGPSSPSSAIWNSMSTPRKRERSSEEPPLQHTGHEHGRVRRRSRAVRPSRGGHACPVAGPARYRHAVNPAQLGLAGGDRAAGPIRRHGHLGVLPGACGISGGRPLSDSPASAPCSPRDAHRWTVAAGEAVLTDRQVQTALGGDHYVASVREAVDAAVTSFSERPASPDAAAQSVSATTPV